MGRMAVWIGCVIGVVASCAAAQSGGGEGREMRAAIVALRGSEGSERMGAVQSLEQQGLMLIEGKNAEITTSDAYQILTAEQAYIGAILRASRLEMDGLPEIPPQDPCEEDPGPYEHLSAFRAAARHASYDMWRCLIVADCDGVLDRASAIMRMGNALIGTGHALDAMMGGAMRRLASEKLGAMADACEKDPWMWNAFSQEAFAGLCAAVESRPAIDPDGTREWTVGDMRRRISWLREQFAGEGGAVRFRAYLERHGKTEEELRRSGALAVALASEDGFRVLLEAAPEKRKQLMLDYWESLTEEQGADAIAEHERSTELAEWLPHVPRLYPDEPQNPTEEELARILDEIEGLASRLESASSREEVDEAFVLLRLAVERDRTQLTRIASMAGMSVLSWRSSLEGYDDAVGVVERLGRFVREDD